MTRASWAPGLLAILAVLGWTPAGKADVGMRRILTGETILYVGEVADQFKDQVRRATGTDAAVGFRYSYIAFLFLDLWTERGEYCLYKGKTCWLLNRDGKTPSARTAALLLGRPESSLGKPFLYTYPLGLLLLGGFAAIAIPAGVISERSRNQRKVKRLFRDEHYLRAVEIVAEHARMEAEARAAQSARPAVAEEIPGETAAPEPKLDRGFEAGVDYLAAPEDLWGRLPTGPPFGCDPYRTTRTRFTSRRSPRTGMIVSCASCFR